MLFELALTMTVCSIMLEVLAVTKFRLLLELLSKSTIAGLAFSILLSAALGELFGATGVTVLLAGIASSVVMAILYRSGMLVLIQKMIAML